MPFVQPSLRDSCRCRRIPGVETPGYCRVVPAGTSAGGLVARSAIRNSQFEMVRASFPGFILGWTVGAFDVWPSRSDAMTIARHFNAGFNPQSIPSPGGTTGFSKMKSCAKCGDDLSFVQPSRWDWWPCASTPALKRRAIVGLSRWDERGRTCRALRNSQFAIRNCQGFFSGVHFGLDDWGEFAKLRLLSKFN